MSHGTLEESPRDETLAALRATANAARELSICAIAHVRAVEQMLKLAELAAEVASARALAAFDAVNAHWRAN